MNPEHSTTDCRSHPAGGPPACDAGIDVAGGSAPAPSGADAAVEEVAVTPVYQEPISPAPALSGARGRAVGALDRAVPAERISPDEQVYVLPDEWITGDPNDNRLWIGISLYNELRTLRARPLKQGGRITHIDPGDKAAGWCVLFKRSGAEQRVLLSAANPSWPVGGRFCPYRPI